MNQERAANFSSASELMNKASSIFQKINTLEDKKTPEAKEEFEKLFSELLFTLFVLSESYGINLEESFLQTIDDLILGFVQ